MRCAVLAATDAHGLGLPASQLRSATWKTTRWNWWSNSATIKRRTYTCGHCGKGVGTDTGYSVTQGGIALIWICPFCTLPTLFESTKGVERQIPGVAPGNEVEHLPADVAVLYTEARNCVSVNAFTAAVMAARKVLMNIAVEQGAKENQGVAWYVQWLDDNGYVPPGGQSGSAASRTSATRQITKSRPSTRTTRGRSSRSWRCC